MFHVKRPPYPTRPGGRSRLTDCPLAERYVELLATAGVERGLIGPREAPRLWERHVLNCLALSSALPHGSLRRRPGLGRRTAGPGAGDRTTRPRRDAGRAAAAARDLPRGGGGRPWGWPAWPWSGSRAEALAGRRRFDVVTARALAPLDRLLGWAMPLVAPHGLPARDEGELGRRRGRRGRARRCATLGCAAAGDPRADRPGRLVHSNRGQGGPRRSGAARVTP